MRQLPLATFGVTEMMALRAQLRTLFESAAPQTFEEASARVVQLFRTSLVDSRGEPACALVRVYKTHPFKQLGPELQAFAASVSGVPADALEWTRCLVLVATAGELPEWNTRQASRGHQAIPLANEAAVREAPMVAGLIDQLGVEIATLLRPAPGDALTAQPPAQNVFYVEEARGSAVIPAQPFVAAHGIRSVLGFGGLLRSGDFVVAILFSKVAIPPAVAEQFGVIGLNFKLALLPWIARPLFGAAAGAP